MKNKKLIILVICGLLLGVTEPFIQATIPLPGDPGQGFGSDVVPDNWNKGKEFGAPFFHEDGNDRPDSVGNFKGNSASTHLDRFSANSDPYSAGAPAALITNSITGLVTWTPVY